MIEAIEVVNGEEVKVLRLSPGEELLAKQDYVCHHVAWNATDESFEEGLDTCRVQYRDDYDTGESWFRVVTTRNWEDDEWEPVSHF